jgi:hypothetical protein
MLADSALASAKSSIGEFLTCLANPSEAGIDRSQPLGRQLRKSIPNTLGGCRTSKSIVMMIARVRGAIDAPWRKPSAWQN